MGDRTNLLEMYAALRQAFGHRNWWPAQSPFEVIVGAVLTQNTNWDNVEKAVDSLREAGLLSPSALSEAAPQRLHELIRPAGYYRQKAGRLQRLARWVGEHCIEADSELGALKWEPLDQLREELLALNGVGPETADSILLYALEKPVFVVDAYTVRILGRHELIEPDATYGDVQEHFVHRLPPDVELFKDFHAQLVEVGKRYCRKRRPRCAECPLRPLLGEPVLEESDEA